MKLVAESGLWSTGPQSTPTPLVAVLEVSGAVLSWTIDDAAVAPTITFTDVSRADWLWRLLGESGHSAVAAAMNGRLPDNAQTIDVNGVAVLPGSVDQLRRLALGHWMRRWWPASHRDGIAALNGALLDAEIALLTSGAQDFFGDDTFDSDMAGLLAGHSAALNELVRVGDPRVVDLVRSASELTDDVGIVLAEPVATAPQRDDYALAAGADRDRRATEAIARGTTSVAWAGVPPAIFDAAENTVDWHVEAAAPGVDAVVAVELLGSGSPAGIAARLRAGDLRGEGVLDYRGHARFPLLDAQQQPVTESAAWNHDWQFPRLTVGVDVDESAQTRGRVRDFARVRLAAPAGDAFLAEILAAESDY
ncbi:hypothetical protein [Mycobacterium sp. ITM-2016-00318]|uniref:hypothetical protein n=1 Tax=Mycobacterium sp. ITM-2016-00318 TaxID=2099693 RepID=UPI000CF90039|nr:hypothetical protein [Mycobacterium sp. ITM-2016-00318]WNG90574.1 hypothetical protein C6A82_013400 [Mycobacterium sp. ITM-2016-00318]